MPIAALGEVAASRFAFRGMILTPDGSSAWTAHREGAPAEALKLAEDAIRAAINDVRKKTGQAAEKQPATAGAAS